MKKVSLKVKLTLLYTACMVFIIGVIFAILFSISNREVLASTQMKLKNRVQESMDEVEWDDKELEIDSDFYQVEDNVYLAMYDQNSNFLYGKLPSGFTQPMEFLNDEVRRIKEDQKDKNFRYYVFSNHNIEIDNEITNYPIYMIDLIKKPVMENGTLKIDIGSL